MSDLNILKELNDRLLSHGSWLYDEYESRIDFDTFFDPFSVEFKVMPIEQKMLILKELFYCKIEPVLLGLLYRSFCVQYMHDDLYADFGHALLEILKGASVEDISSLDIHRPQNWYRGTGDTPPTMESHEVIVRVLDMMFPEFQIQLLDHKDLLMRKRLIYLNYTKDSNNVYITPNQDPLFDQIDEELLRRVETIESDVKMRYGTISLLVEDIHDELVPEHKKERLALAELLYKSIENMDTGTLKGLPMFRNTDIDHFVDIKKYPKKWLYSCVSDFALKRDLCKIRGVEFIK